MLAYNADVALSVQIMYTATVGQLIYYKHFCRRARQRPLQSIPTSTHFQRIA